MLKQENKVMIWFILIGSSSKASPGSMVTIKLQNLIDFVADVFVHTGSRLRRRGASQLSCHRESDRT